MGNDTQKPARWSYTAEDFLESTAPYEELEKCNGDPFLQQRMIEAMSKYAASIGFRGLKLMYKRYQQSIRTSRGAYIGENPTNFENQPIELDAGKWEADDSGVRRSDGFGDAVACPHPILPVERLVNIDTGEEKLRLAFRKGAIWRKIIVSKVILANANKVTELAGCGVAVTSQNARAFVEYISDIENLNYDVIPERKSIGRFGYIPDEGFSPFVDGLIFDGDASFAAMFQTVRSHGSEAKWLDIAAEVRAMSTTAKIILAASFSSVLLEPLGCLPFFVHLWGVDSGTGKTVALMVAASVWGDPAIGNYVKTFDGTVVGMEKTAAFLNELPLCLDELQLAKDNKGRTNFDVYKLAQGVGRTRGNRAGGVDLTPTWHNCILTTGESPLTGQASGAGAVNRVIDIECKASQAVIKDGMHVSGMVKRNYGYAGKRFVEELYKPGVIEQIAPRYRNKSGQSEEVTDDYRLRLLNEETGDLLDAFQWKCTLVRDYLLPGNGYTYVDWVSNRIDGLYYVDPMQVSAEIGADPIFKTARFFIGGRSYRDYEIMRILRNTRDGVTGSGLVAESPIQLETMLNALKYENRMVKTGAKKGFLKVEKDKKVSQTVLDQLRNSWRKMYGPDSEETTVILNDGVDFKDAGQTAVETQLNENKQTNAHEIYRIFNIAPTILEGDATAEDLKNTVRFAIAPVVKALQLAINRFCLLEAEKGVLAFEIDMDALDGTDMLARYQAYEVAIRNGWMQLDEVRYDEGRNPLGLKFIRLGLDTVIYDPESRMIYTPNTKEWASIDQKGGGEPIAGRDPSG